MEFSIAFAAAGLALLIRATGNTFPLVKRLLTWYKGKPFCCALCLVGWSALVLVGKPGVEWLAATGLGTLVTVAALWLMEQ